MENQMKRNAATRAAESVVARLSEKNRLLDDYENESLIDEIRSDVQEAILEELMKWTSGIGRTG